MASSSIRTPLIPASSAHFRGFSLVEIVIALGIVAFALLGIVGLFTAGLRAEKDSYEDTKLADIVATVASSLKSGQYTNLATPLTFDHEGNVADKAGADAPYFSVAFTLPSATLNRPGMTNLQLIRILVSYPVQAPSPQRKIFQLSTLTNTP